MLELKKQKIERQILWSDRLCIPISKAGTVGSILLKANPSMFLTREMLVPLDWQWEASLLLPLSGMFLRPTPGPTWYVRGSAVPLG